MSDAQEAKEKEAGCSAVHRAGRAVDQCHLLPRAQHQPAGELLQHILRSCP